MSFNCRISKLLSFETVLSFNRARRKPDCSHRIDPIRIELQHLVVESSRRRRCPGYAVKIADVLLGLCFVPRARSLVTVGIPGVTNTSHFRDSVTLPPVLKSFLSACLMHASL